MVVGGAVRHPTNARPGIILVIGSCARSSARRSGRRFPSSTAGNRLWASSARFAFSPSIESGSR